MQINQSSKLTVANLSPENPIYHLIKMWVAKSCCLGICYNSNFLEEQAVFSLKLFFYLSDKTQFHIWSKQGSHMSPDQQSQTPFFGLGLQLFRKN